MYEKAYRPRFIRHQIKDGKNNKKIIGKNRITKT